MKEKLTVAQADLNKTKKALALASVTVLQIAQVGTDLNKVEVKFLTGQQLFDAGCYFSKVDDTPIIEKPKKVNPIKKSVKQSKIKNHVKNKN